EVLIKVYSFAAKSNYDYSIIDEGAGHLPFFSLKKWMDTRGMSPRKPLLALSLALLAFLILAASVGTEGAERLRGLPSELAIGDIVHVATGEKIDFSELAGFFDGARIVYVGEVHTNAEAHEFQLQVLKEFYERYGDNIAIGMEMFKRPYQDVLDRWSRGEISEEELLRDTHWKEEWGYDYGLYKGIMDFAREKKIPVIALNVTKELQKKISRKGLSGISDADRATLPSIDTTDFYHRRYLQKIFKGHTDMSGDFDKFYEVQCVWEDVMADSIARYLSSPRGSGCKKFLAFMGDSHIIYDFGVPKRVFHRLHLPYSTVYTYELDEKGVSGEEHYLFLRDIPLQPADFIRVIRPSERREKRAVLGVTIRDIGRDKVVIQDVAKGSPAEAAGLQVGDIVVSMDGQHVAEVHDIILLIRRKRLGDRGKIEISREGKRVMVDVTFFEIKGD
ncbi:MAG: ChaN family lipoprotein, partial [Candidatus Brocadiales bacterium]